MPNRKGITSFLVITFGVTYLVEGILILSGFRVTSLPAVIGQYVIAGVMWVPAAAALITVRFITHEKINSLSLRFGPSWKPYLVTAMLIPLGFLLTYLLTWLLGLGKPDWLLVSFFGTIAASGVDMSTAPSPALLLTALFLISLVAAPFFNSILGLGEELGWRGYLLPRLMPLGKWKAYLLLGAIWGLWHAPLVAVGFNYPGSPVLGILLMMMLTTAIGFYINELTLRYKSAILAGWIHGVFNSQSYGIWRALLFANTNPFLGGITGLVGISVLSIIGVSTMRWAQRTPTSQPSGPGRELDENQAVEITATWNLLNH
jgi:membrane protease YdiL (CAAX protease family)